MSIKRLFRLFIFIVTFFMSLVALAGGAEHTLSYSGIYIEANGGYAFRNWRNDGLVQNYITTFQGGAVFGPFDNGRDGGTAGAVLGYQFNEFIALEGGWFYLPQFRYTVAAGNVVAAGNQMTVDGWLTYGAVKLLVPIYSNTFLFGKLGPAYVRNRGSFSGGTSVGIAGAGLPTNGNFWAPLFAAGVEYFFCKYGSVNFQYLYVRGYGKVPLAVAQTHFPSPDTNLFTLGLGFKFL